MKNNNNNNNNNNQVQSCASYQQKSGLYLHSCGCQLSICHLVTFTIQEFLLQKMMNAKIRQQCLIHLKWMFPMGLPPVIIQNCMVTWGSLQKPPQVGASGGCIEISSSKPSLAMGQRLPWEACDICPSSRETHTSCPCCITWKITAGHQ